MYGLTLVAQTNRAPSKSAKRLIPCTGGIKMQNTVMFISITSTEILGRNLFPRISGLREAGLYRNCMPHQWLCSQIGDGSPWETKSLWQASSHVRLVLNQQPQRQVIFIDIPLLRRCHGRREEVTTHTEDVAYCLMGLFGVNMPLLYGEGDRAFLLLQEEIIKYNDDQTMFAWSMSKKKFSGLLAPQGAGGSYQLCLLEDANLSR